MGEKERNVKAASARKKELYEILKKTGNSGRRTERLKEEFMRDGKAEIHVSLKETEWADPLSWPSQRRMNGDVFEYIGECADPLPDLTPIRLVLHGAPKEDEKEIRGLIQKHYEAELWTQQEERRSCQHRLIFMAAVGLAMMGLYLLLALSRDGTLFLEVLSVIASFCLWEAVNCALVERREIIRRMAQTAQFLTMEVRFDCGAESGGEP